MPLVSDDSSRERPIKDFAMVGPSPNNHLMMDCYHFPWKTHHTRSAPWWTQETFGLLVGEVDRIPFLPGR